MTSIKIISHTFLIFLSFQMTAQNASISMNVTVEIDGEIPETGISDSFILLEAGSQFDTIRFRYIPGDIILNQTDYHRILSIPPKDEVLFSLNYTDLSTGENLKKTYKESFNAEWLQSEYLIIRFKNVKRRRSRGYVTSLSIPQRSVISKLK